MTPQPSLSSVPDATRKTRIIAHHGPTQGDGRARRAHALAGVFLRAACAVCGTPDTGPRRARGKGGDGRLRLQRGRDIGQARSVVDDLAARHRCVLAPPRVLHDERAEQALGLDTVPRV